MGILIQSTYGKRGNFEVLIPRIGGGANHFWRANDEPALPWYGPCMAFGSRDDVTAISLVQQQFGELAAVRREGRLLKFSERSTYEYNGHPIIRWLSSEDVPKADGAERGVGLSVEPHRHFHIVAPQSSGGLAHWLRTGDPQDPLWHGPTPIVESGNFLAVALISNFSESTLEVIAWRKDIGLVHFHHGWDGWLQMEILPESGSVSGPPALCQCFNGPSSDILQVVAPDAVGGFRHWWRKLSPLPRWKVSRQPIGTGAIRDLGLIQSNFDQGNLEVIVERYPGYLLSGALDHAYATPLGSSEPEPWSWSPLSQVWRPVYRDPRQWGRASIVANLTWHPPLPPVPVPVGIHMVLLHSHGESRSHGVLMFGFGEPSEEGGSGAMIFDPVSESVTWIDTSDPRHHLFCSGHALMPNGHVLVVGGHGNADHVRGVHRFDPSAYTLEHVADMEEGRWYPTVTCLADGRMLIVSGSGEGRNPDNGEPVYGGPTWPFGHAPVNATTQIFDSETRVLGPRDDTPHPFYWASDGMNYDVDLYPFVFQLPSGNQLTSRKVLVHSRNATRFFDPKTNKWDEFLIPAKRTQSRTYPAQGTAVMLPLRAIEGYRARILVMGGGGLDREEYQKSPTADEPAINRVELLDLGEATPAWVEHVPMKHARVLCDSVLLPDGTVLVVGGSASGKSDNGTEPVLPAELYDPRTKRWKELASISVPRMYHSTAILLPDTRVLMAGKDGEFQRDPFKYFEHRVEIFSPPYLYDISPPQMGPPYPPFSAEYGEEISVGFSRFCPPPVRVTLVRAGSVTHGFNMDQRLIEPPLEVTSSTTARVTMPPDGYIAPPGYYMLFLLSAQGVPSSGRFIMLH